MLTKNLSRVSLAFAVLLFNAPCFAQNEIENNQPVAGDLHTRETAIQAKLKSKYDAGLLDADQLAKYQRDFDGICVEEDDIKSRGNGMTESGRKTIMKKLDNFEANLDKQTGGEAKKSTK
jgi:hypothetical protein